MTPTPTSIASLNTAKRVLDEVTNTLIHKGYYMPPDYTDVPCGQILIPEPTLRKFARLTAKELKRPFVQVKWETRWRGNHDGLYHRCLVVEAPKRKYTTPLINPLMLVASPDPSADIWWSQGKKSLWYFQIFDLEFANQYLSYFDTREEFRIALKLPPKVSNITPLQEAA